MVSLLLYYLNSHKLTANPNTRGRRYNALGKWTMLCVVFNSLIYGSSKPIVMKKRRKKPGNLYIKTFYEATLAKLPSRTL